LTLSSQLSNKKKLIQTNARR